MTNKDCIQCGKDIAHKRSDAKYCSDRCRMRYRRVQIKEELIKELVELFYQIPNHSVHYTDQGICLEEWNAFTRESQKWDLFTLKDMSNDQLEELIKAKTLRLTGETIANIFFNRS